VQGELAAALRRAGIEAYTPKGEAFDPTIHEAMAQQPVEGAAPGTVVEVYQPGYRLADTILRPARVVVAA
jgi:molecular chaperone GrpE